MYTDAPGLLSSPCHKASATCLSYTCGVSFGSPGGKVFRYRAMAVRSASLRCCMLCSTTSLMPPNTALRSLRPVLRNCTSCASLQLPRPSLWSPRRFLAIQPSSGALPARNCSPSAGLRASSCIVRARGVWQAPQWPRPSTR